MAGTGRATDLREVEMRCWTQLRMLTHSVRDQLERLLVDIAQHAHLKVTLHTHVDSTLRPRCRDALRCVSHTPPRCRQNSAVMATEHLQPVELSSSPPA